MTPHQRRPPGHGDIAALRSRMDGLEGRTTAVEQKNASQAAARGMLNDRAKKVQGEVDDLRYIISGGSGRKALTTTASAFRASANSALLIRSGRKVLTTTASSAKGSSRSAMLQKTGSSGSYYNALNICHGDGATDDTNHILAAISSYKAAGQAGVYFPAGTYKLSTRLVVPDSSVLVGAGIGSVHLKGPLSFGDNSSFSDMKIGTPGTSTQSAATATGTSFNRCQFRGGGGSLGSNDTAVVYLAGDVSHLRFEDCNIEVNFGTGTGDTSFNSVAVWPNLSGTSVHNILFHGCHFGVSNGVSTVAPRFHVEIYEDHHAGTRTTGTREFNFEDCIFEAAASASIDYSGSTLSSDNETPNCGYSHITGCIFKGNGAGSDQEYCNDITAEDGAGYLTITGNTFYRGYLCAFASFKNSYGGHNIFSDNTIDATNAVLNTGITHWEGLAYIRIASHYNTITNNTMNTWTENRALELMTGGNNNTITGNTITSPDGSDSIVINGGNNNNISGNTYL